jgi:hypothetical protein
VDEHVLAAAVGLNKPKALRWIESFDSTSRHVHFSLLKQWATNLDWLWRALQEIMRPQKVASGRAPDGGGRAGLRQLAVSGAMPRRLVVVIPDDRVPIAPNSPW